MELTVGPVDIGVDEVVEETAAVSADATGVGARLTYAEQLGLGAAKGQVGSWHKESSCGPWDGSPLLVGGAHRKLYR